MRLLSALFFLMTLLISACGPVTPVPLPKEPTASPIVITAPEAEYYPGFEPITPENINRLEQIYQLGTGNILGLAVSPDKHTIAVYTMEGIYLYDSPSLKQKELITRSLPKGRIIGRYFPITFSPDGNLLAFSVGENVLFFDLSKHQYVDNYVFSIIPDWPISNIEFSPDGSRILLTTTGGSLLCDGGQVNFALYDLKHKMLSDRYFCTQEAEYYYRFTQNGKVYFFFSSIMSEKLPLAIDVVDTKTGNLLEAYAYDFPSNEYDPEKFFYDISPDGEILASARYQSGGYVTKLLDSKTRDVLSEVSGLIGFVPTGDGKFLSQPRQDRPRSSGQKYLDSAILRKCLPENFMWVQGEKLGEDRVLLFDDASLQVINLSNCKTEKLLRYPSANHAIFSPNERLLATYSKDCIYIWDLTTGNLLTEIHAPPSGESIDVFAFNSDGSRLLTGPLGSPNFYPDQPNRNYAIAVWDTQTGKKLRELIPQGEFLRRIHATPDKDIVMAEDTSKLNFWNIKTGELLSAIPSGVFVFTKRDDAVWVAFINQTSNRSKELDDIQTITLYDYRTGKVLRRLPSLQASIRHLYINTNGAQLAAHLFLGQTTGDALHILDTTTGEILWNIQWNVLTNPFIREPDYWDDWTDYGFTKKFYLAQTGEAFAKYGFDLYTESWHFQSESPYRTIPGGELTTDKKIIVNRNSSLPYSYTKELVQFWDARAGNFLGEIGLTYNTQKMFFGPKGYLMGVVGKDGILRIWGVRKP